MQKIEQGLSYFTDKINDCIKSGKSISVITHIDCDGLTSGSIITKALIRAGAKCTVRTSNEFNKTVIESMQKDSRDFYLITDLGGGSANDLDQLLSDRWCVLDHHQIPEAEFDNEKV